MATHRHWSSSDATPVEAPVVTEAAIPAAVVTQATPASVWAWIYQADLYEDSITKLFAEESDARSHSLQYAKDNADEWDDDEDEDDQAGSFYEDASYHCIKRMEVKRS